MPTWSLVTAPAYLTIHLLRKHNAPLPLTYICKSAASARYFSPDYLRCPTTRPVSCYALFKSWLLLAKILAVWAIEHPYALSIYFGALADSLGCSPLAREPYRPRPVSQ